MRSVEARFRNVILENGVIRTLDPSIPTLRALAIAGDRIAGGVGTHETALASPDVVDLGGRVVVPGFSDAHVHFPTVVARAAAGARSRERARSRRRSRASRAAPSASPGTLAARARLAQRRLAAGRRADEGGARRGDAATGRPR